MSILSKIVVFVVAAILCLIYLAGRAEEERRKHNIMYVRAKNMEEEV